MKNKKYYLQNVVGKIPQSIIKSIETEAKWYPNTHLHDLSPSWFWTGIPIKSGGKKPVQWAHTSPLSEKMCRARVFKFLIMYLIKDSIIRHSPWYSWNTADGELQM